MDEKFEILLEISKNPHTSNRKLSRITGKAVGTINGKIHELIEEGHIEVIKATSRTFFYQLTVQGRLYLAELLHSHTVSAFSLVERARMQTRMAVSGCLSKGNKTFYLYGAKDALYRIAKMTLIEMSLEHEISYTDLDKLDDLKEFVTETNKDTYCILTWEAKHENCHAYAINILL